MSQNPLVVVCGPTAAGKTSLALGLGRTFNGELVSVDSRQVYKGMGIGTGKEPISDSKVERREGYWVVDGIKIHLYDVLVPSEGLNVVQFAQIAGPVIERVWARGKLPILVGGSGLYLEVLLGKVGVAKVPQNPQLREELAGLPNEGLLSRLREVDSERAATIDKKSPHRLVRAIEIALGREGCSPDPGIVEVLPPGLDPLWVGLNAPREILYATIDQRIDRMVAAGLLGEIQQLVEKYGWGAPALNSIGYSEFKPYIDGEATLEECSQRAKFNSHAYARRQLTWFRRNKGIQWFDITEADFDQEVSGLVESYLKEY